MFLISPPKFLSTLLACVLLLQTPCFSEASPEFQDAFSDVHKAPILLVNPMEEAAHVNENQRSLEDMHRWINHAHHHYDEQVLAHKRQARLNAIDSGLKLVFYVASYAYCRISGVYFYDSEDPTMFSLGIANLLLIATEVYLWIHDPLNPAPVPPRFELQHLN